ncbi:MAG: hypothetical protein R3C58_12225 [Parvularculaceae bacterium]
MADQKTPPLAQLSPDEQKQRARRNLALALSLGGFIVIVFLVTILRLSGAGAP